MATIPDRTLRTPLIASAFGDTDGEIFVQQIFRPNFFFRPKNFSIDKFLGQKTFRPDNFSTENKFGQKIFSSEKAENFFGRKCFRPKIFSAENFSAQIFSAEKFSAENFAVRIAEGGSNWGGSGVGGSPPRSVRPSIRGVGRRQLFRDAVTRIPVNYSRRSANQALRNIL